MCGIPREMHLWVLTDSRSSLWRLSPLVARMDLWEFTINSENMWLLQTYKLTAKLLWTLVSQWISEGKVRGNIYIFFIQWISFHSPNSFQIQPTHQAPCVLFCFLWKTNRQRNQNQGGKREKTQKTGTQTHAHRHKNTCIYTTPPCTLTYIDMHTPTHAHIHTHKPIKIQNCIS